MKTSIFPAFLPRSAIAGVTKPTIMSGTRNPSNWPKISLNVAQKRAIHTGAHVPARIPMPMATIMRGSNPNFIWLGLEVVFISNMCRYEHTSVSLILRRTRRYVNVVKAGAVYSAGAASSAGASVAAAAASASAFAAAISAFFLATASALALFEACSASRRALSSCSFLEAIEAF